MLSKVNDNGGLLAFRINYVLYARHRTFSLSFFNIFYMIYPENVLIHGLEVNSLSSKIL